MIKVMSSPVKGWFVQGWSKYKKHHKPLIGGALIHFGWGTFVGLSFKFLPFGMWIFLLEILILIVGPVLTVGWLFLCLRSVRDQEPKVSDMFRPFARFGHVWLTHIILTLIVVAGLILLIIPGIIWGLKYGLSLFAIMDKSMKAREAIKFSGKITYGYKGKLFEVALIMLALGFIGYPVTYVLNHLGEKLHPIMLIAATILLPVSVLIITPWTAATLAVAYDEIVRAKTPSEHGQQ